MKSTRLSPIAFCALVVVLLFFVGIGLETEVFARAGSGRTSGRTTTGAPRSYQKPPAQQPPAQAGELQQQRTPVSPAPAAPARGMFSGIGGMLFGGMLGALLFRSLGFSGDSDWGKEVFAFGDLFILLILLTLAFLVFRHFRNRSARPLTAAGPGAFTEPAMAYTALPASDPPPALPFPALAHIRSTDPAFSEPDFLSFAREVFTRVQERWAQRDVKGLRPLLSPEMAALFEKDLARLIAEKKINRIEDIRIRKAEISDALQDRGEDLITVKLDVLLHDCTVDEKSGQVLAGDSREPISFSEYWTFSRTIGEGNWVVAGISQDSAQ